MGSSYDYNYSYSCDHTNNRKEYISRSTIIVPFLSTFIITYTTDIDTFIVSPSRASTVFPTHVRRNERRNVVALVRIQIQWDGHCVHEPSPTIFFSSTLAFVNLF